MFRIYKYEGDEAFGKGSFEEESDLEDESANNPNREEDSDELESSDSEDNFDGLDDEESQGEDEEEDPDFQGVIRTVTGACLVYKRKTEENNYEELWVYNVGGRDIKPEMKIRNSILAGTDVDPKTQKSEDGQQTADTISVGNVQFLHIKGLVN